MLELFILKPLILCHICCRTFSLDCHVSLCSFKYFNLYFMASGIYGMFRGDFPIPKLFFFCSLFHSVNLFALVSLIHLKFIIEMEVRIGILFLNAETTVSNYLMNPRVIIFLLDTFYWLFSHIYYSIYTLQPFFFYSSIEETTFGIIFELNENWHFYDTKCSI